MTSALGGAAIEYRVIEGVAVFLHVSEKDPLAARVTRDIDPAVDRQDHSAGVDMLLDAERPDVRSAGHLIMVQEKVRPEYLEAMPELSERVQAEEGVLLAPVRTWCA